MTAVAVAMASAPVSPAAGAGAPQFGADVVLPGGQGGEPSLAIDTTNSGDRNHMYAVAIGDANGPLEWYSYDHGRSWGGPVPYDLDGELRGGDSDVVVNTNSDVIATDLNVSHASVQISVDDGKSFDQGTVTGPENDRPWLTAAGKDVYLVYHDFVGEVPVVCHSTDGGHTFPVCTQAFGANPQSISQCAENTVPARPLAIDPKNGSLNFLYSCSTQAENAAQPPYGPLHDYYLAQSTDGGVTFTTYPVFLADTSGGKRPSYGNIFGTLAIDAAGNYYALIDGTRNDADPAANPYHVYLIRSTDHGHTWSRPVQVDHDANGAGTHVLPHIAVTARGNVDIVWYGTSATGEPNGVCGTIAQQSPCKDGLPPYNKPGAPAWRVYLAQSTDALAARPHFTQVVVNRTPTHYGRICTNGLVCGGSDRTLLDFISVAVDCFGKAHIVYGGNTKAEEAAGKTFVHAANQTAGATIAPPAACRR